MNIANTYIIIHTARNPAWQFENRDEATSSGRVLTMQYQDGEGTRRSILVLILWRGGLATKPPLVIYILCCANNLMGHKAV